MTGSSVHTVARAGSSLIWDQWVRQEFLHKMRSEGRVPELHGLARDRKMNEFKQTRSNIFCTEEEMLEKANERLQATKAARASRRSQKSQMKQRLDQLEKLVHQVADDNSRLQMEIETLRSPVKPATSQDA